MKKEIILNNNTTIPCIGFGTWQTPDGAVAVESVKAALEAGYRHIDTAQGYRNEGSVGTAWRASGLPRESLYITTKLSNRVRGYEETIAAIEASLELLQTDYIDLFLIHWPNPIHYRDQWEEANANSWRAMESFVEKGKIKSLGISNFMPHHVEALMKTAKIKPVINQVFLAPGALQPDVIENARKYDMVLEAYSPLGTGKIFDVEVMNTLASKYNKTVAQVALRWSLQQGFVPLPKSVTPSRIAENLDVFDFEIDEEDMTLLNHLQGNVGTQTNPDEITF